MRRRGCGRPRRTSFASRLEAQAADEAAKAVAQKTVTDVTALQATAQQQAKSDADMLAANREQVTQFCIEHFYVASLKPLTPEQAQAVRNQMVQLQRDLAGGVANGDPKAKAAAELLRQSTMR